MMSLRAEVWTKMNVIDRGVWTEEGKQSASIGSTKETSAC